jgi:hypothetical protein
LGDSVISSAPAKVAATGQTTTFAPGDDGDIEAGVAWPQPRFTDNGDVTITDNLTGLVWLKDADCFGFRNWNTALSEANSLASGSCGLTDGSAAGDWRLPNINELKSLTNAGESNPAVWLDNQGFSNVQSDLYWSSTVYAPDTSLAWIVDMGDGLVSVSNKSDFRFVRPVRSGQGGSLGDSVITPTPTPPTPTPAPATPTPEPERGCPAEFALDEAAQAGDKALVNKTLKGELRKENGVKDSSYGVKALAFYSDTLRWFRDNTLSRAAAGLDLIRLYYEHSAEVTNILRRDEDLKNRSAKALKELAQIIRNSASRDNVTDIVGSIPPSLRLEIDGLIAEISKQANRGLKEAIKEAMAMLDAGY